MVDGVKLAVGNSLNQVLKAEIAVFLGTPGQEVNKRNGNTERDYAIKGTGTVRLMLPNDRKKLFSSAVIPKHERVTPGLQKILQP